MNAEKREKVRAWLQDWHFEGSPGADYSEVYIVNGVFCSDYIDNRTLDEDEAEKLYDNDREIEEGFFPTEEEIAKMDDKEYKDFWRKRSTQRGLPDTIWKQKYIQDYVDDENGLLYGYLGHSNRTEQRDKLIVETLREMGYTINKIAKTLCDGDMRHIMDGCPLDMSDKEFVEYITTTSWLR